MVTFFARSVTFFIKRIVSRVGLQGAGSAVGCTESRQKILIIGTGYAEDVIIVKNEKPSKAYGRTESERTARFCVFWR